MLHIFYTYVLSVLSGCCITFAMIFKYFLGVFASRDMFQVFHPSFLYVEVLHLNVSKVDRSITHGMRVTSGRGRERSPARVGVGDVQGGVGPLLGCSLTSLTLLELLACLLHGHHLMLALQIGRPDVSKSDLPKVYIYREYTL
jgi:hypothetical protein